MRVSNRDIRVSDAERDAAAELLGAHFRAGRLHLHEYDERVGRAYAARTYGELRPLFADLPRPPAAIRGNQALASLETATGHALDRIRMFLVAVVLVLVVFVMLALSNPWALLVIPFGLLALRMSRSARRSDGRIRASRAYSRR